MNDGGKGPWGGRPGGSGDGEKGGDGSNGGPRNPWAMPPGGKRERTGSSSLDEFLRRTRGGGGPGGSGGGFGGFQMPGGPAVWYLGFGAVVLIWLLMTAVWSIAPREQGVVTVFGRYYGVLQPGLNFTLPAPFASVTKINFGGTRTDDFPQGGGSENLVLTGDQNIVDLSYSVRWDVKNAQNYVFQIAEPELTVRAAAESAMRASIATVTLDQAIGAGREQIESDVQQRMQAMLDDYQSGVRVLGVALKPVNPPAAVDDAFKAVTASQQQAQANLNNARAYAQQVLARAQGDAVQFDKIYEQYRLAPEVTRRRLYYETMEEVLARSNKTILEPRGAAPYLPLPTLRGQRNTPPAEVPAPAEPATGAAQ